MMGRYLLHCFIAAASLILSWTPVTAQTVTGTYSSFFKKLFKTAKTKTTYDSGMNVSGRWKSGYVTAIKPMNNSEHALGWRLRSFASYGQYDYLASGMTIAGLSQSQELMLGYHFNAGPLWSKIYTGSHREEHTLQYFDPSNKRQGLEWGAKILSENWINIGEKQFVALDFSYSTIHNQIDAQARTGVKWEALLLGIEGKISRDIEFSRRYAGAFVEWDTEIFGREFGIGAAGGWTFFEDQEPDIYTRLKFVTKY